MCLCVCVVCACNNTVSVWVKLASILDLATTARNLHTYGTPIMSIIDRPKSAAFINRSCNCRVLSSIDHAIVGCFHQSITINRLLPMD